MALVMLMSDLSNRASANSYITTVQAETYYECRVDRQAYLTFDPQQFEGALVTAAALLNELEWNGNQSTDDTQLAFPRNLSILPGANGNFSGRLIQLQESDGVPRKIRDAQAELAYHLLINVGITSDTGGLSPTAGLTVGSIELSSLQDPSLIPQYILRPLRTYLQGGGTRQVFVGA